MRTKILHKPDEFMQEFVRRSPLMFVSTIGGLQLASLVGARTEREIEQSAQVFEGLYRTGLY